MRAVYVAYGDVSKVPLKPSAKPLDALLQTGFDLYLEVSPKRWARAVDLPDNHPANVNFKAGAYKTGLTDANGQTFTVLNAFNPEHRALAAREGLFINIPFSEDKRKELLETLQKIKDELQVLTESRFLELQGRIDKIKQRLGILKELKALEREVEERAKAQSLWDGTINETLSLTEALEKVVELSNMVFPTRYEQWAARQAIEKAKKEAALEEGIESSILLNPERLKELRERLLAP
jgi:hypothetical protein